MKLIRNSSILLSPKYMNLNISLRLNNLKRFEYKANRNYSVKTSYNEKEWHKRNENKDNERNYSGIHPYHNLFEWKSMREFTQMLANNVVYNDGNLIAICKPWGVGIHTSHVNINDRNSYLLNNTITGSSKYCISESLETLSQLIGVKKLKFVKTVDRYMSGILLLATNELTEKSVIKSINRSKPMEIPFMKFWCITRGYPDINENTVKERVGIKLIEIDELGDHKESIIISSDKLTNNMRKRKESKYDGLKVCTVLSQIKIIDKNKSLSAALVELSSTSTKHHFIQCYLANTASFVLGDIRYSRRVKHIMGTPMSVNPTKLNFNEDLEPLPNNICKHLRIRGNSYIPLMIHLKSITLPKYLNKNDLVIDTNIPLIPEHFMWTLNKLQLKIPDSK